MSEVFTLPFQRCFSPQAVSCGSVRCGHGERPLCVAKPSGTDPVVRVPVLLHRPPRVEQGLWRNTGCFGHISLNTHPTLPPPVCHVGVLGTC